MGSSTSVWGAAGWWTIVVYSVPFAVYTAVFAYGDFDLYKVCTVSWLAGEHDTAGRNIQQHVRVWQFHAVGAELYMFFGAFQFSRSFRRKYPAAHRRMGYAFVAVAISLAASAAVMLPHSEFGPVGRTVVAGQGVFTIVAMIAAVWMARQKKFQVHQKFMIRGAAAGYAVMGVRFLVFFLHGAVRMAVWPASELAFVLSVVIFLGSAEVYVQTVLNAKPRRPATSSEAKTARSE